MKQITKKPKLIHRKVRFENLKQPVILLTDLIHLPRTLIIQGVPELTIRNDLGTAGIGKIKENGTAQIIRNTHEIKSGSKMKHSETDYDENSYGDDSETVSVTNTNESLVCDLCCERFMNRDEKLDHVLNCHCGPKTEVNNLIFTCTLCDVRFKNEKELEGHFIFHEIQSFTCTTCKKSYRYIDKLIRHRIRKHPVKRNGSYICDTCGLPYKTRNNLVQHVMKSHVPRTPFVCEACDISFSSKIHLDEHKKTHEKKKTFTCTDCGLSFSEKFYLKRHSAVHTDIKPFKCDTCGNAFRLSTDLKRHLSIHTGERPFNCINCEATFVHKEGLRRHVKKIVCCKCDEVFHCKTNFDEHSCIFLL